MRQNGFVWDMADIEAEYEDKVLMAELVSEASNSRRELNISAVSTIVISIVFLLLAMSFGEAVLDDAKESEEFSGEWWETPLHLRHTMDLPMDTLRAQ